MKAHSKNRQAFVSVPVVVLLLALLLGLVRPAATQASTPSGPDDLIPIEISGPPGSGLFGVYLYSLPNGNFAVVDYEYDAGALADVGAVYLYEGATRTLISTLTGSQAGDRVGYDGLSILPDGNFLVKSPEWANGAQAQAGAVTWCSSETGCNGPVTPANSLVGSTANDWVGVGGVHGQADGKYIVFSSYWANGAAAMAGALTWCAAGGSCVGPVTPANSLVGTSTNDQVGEDGAIELSGGAFVVSNPNWNNSATPMVGAVTWCPAAGCTGPVTPANSLIGSTAGDQVSSNHTLATSAGGYVVSSANWDNGAKADVGAATWCPATGCQGMVVSPANSLIGSTAGDQIGAHTRMLANGNFIVYSETWDNTSTGATDAGAVTWCSGTGGCNGATVSAANSLYGAKTNDHVGSTQSITMLDGDNAYTVVSKDWDNGGVVDAGAVTPCSGAAVCVGGAISSANSLVGANAGDGTGSVRVTALKGGSYVVMMSSYDYSGISAVGAVIWCPSTGCTGMLVSAAALLGASAADQIGSIIRDLGSGAFVVSSPSWRNGGALNAGAVTRCQGNSCAGQVVSAANSLVGTTANDRVGDNNVGVLSNGAYLVKSRAWDNGGLADAGALTWCPAAGCTPGPVSAANSLVGGSAGDYVGDTFTTLPNSAYVVGSQWWDNGALANVGAATWCPATGCTGLVTPANSLLGEVAEARIGNSLSTQPNGNYLITHQYWDAPAAIDAGAVTLGAGFAPTTVGVISAANSVFGGVASGTIVNRFDPVNDQVIIGWPKENKVRFLSLPHSSIADGVWSAATTWDYGALTPNSQAQIANGHTVTLDAEAEIRRLSLAQGRLVLGDHNLLAHAVGLAGDAMLDAPAGAAAVCAGSGGPECMVVADGAGELRRSISANGGYTFYVGDQTGTTDYSPLTFTFISGSFAPGAYVGVRVVDAPHPLSRDPQALSRYWRVSASGITNPVYNLTLGYRPEDVSGAENELVGLQWLGDHWLAGPAADPATHSALMNGLSVFGDITGGSGAARWAIFLPLAQR